MMSPLVTGEVGAGKTVAVRAAMPTWIRPRHVIIFLHRERCST
jgi:type II secretory pathway predicted ATPase ExeA